VSVGRRAIAFGSAAKQRLPRSLYVKAADHPDSDICQNMAAEALKALDRRLHPN